MVVHQFNSLGLLLLPQTTKKCHIRLSQNLKLGEGRKSYAINIDSQTSSISETTATTTTPDTDEGPPVIDFAFVNSRLLPDGSPDVQYRSACGGQKLRDIMLENHVELYGPYARPLLNCGGGGTCGTCIVEVIDGNQLLSPKTPKEKEKLKKKPKKWRLACQTVVGKEDSRGELIIQQLPEWKLHEWE
ncbi:NDH-dependent cyclic electron flow 1 [Carex rostrata]